MRLLAPTLCALVCPLRPATFGPLARTAPARCAPAQCCAPPPVDFDAALAGMLADAAALGDVDAAVDGWLDRLEENFIPTLGSRLEASEAAPVPPPALLRERELMASLQARAGQRFERARDQLQSLLGSGEINKMDAALAGLVKRAEVDAGLFYVMLRNMEDAQAAGNEDDYRVLSHLHTRLQEELEKQTEPALALLHKLTRTDSAPIRANILSHYLLPQSTLLLPDLKTMPLDPPRPALVTPLGLAGAIDGALTKVEAMPIDRALIEATAEDIRSVAKEAHAVVAANYDAALLAEFQEALTPSFARLLPKRPPSEEQ